MCLLFRSTFVREDLTFFSISRSKAQIKSRHLMSLFSESCHLIFVHIKRVDGGSLQ